MSQYERFDVFASHNSSDKPTVIKIGELLRARGLKVWLDLEELRPGLPWQEQIEDVIKTIPAAAIFIGRDGRGPWQELEMRAVLAQFVRRRAPAIPVLLPGVPAEPELPLFLQEFTWVDLRDGLSREGLDRLAWAITGERLPLRGKEEILARRGPPVVHNLRLKSLDTLFKGRAEMLTMVAADLELDPAAAIVQHQQVFHGLGGIGKTRLAVEYAWRSAERYNWVFFVRANSREALNRGLAGLAGPDLVALDLNKSMVESEAVKHVLRWLREHRDWLLILDNVDTPPAALAVRELLPRLGGHVLVTSRLSAWPGIPRHEVDKLEPEEAVLYLLERTDGKRRSCLEDAALAKRLAELLDGLPLALEQAGAHIAAQGWSFRQYVEACEQDLPGVLEWFEQLEMPDYPVSVAMTWNRSFEQLAPASQAMLRLLAHLAADPIPVEMLEEKAELFEDAAKFSDEAESSAAGAAVVEALAELVRYSLITRPEKDVSVHRIVQEVVRARIPEERQRKWVQKAVCLVHEFAPHQPDDVQTWPVWDLLRPHATRVIELAEQAGVLTPTSSLMIELGLLLKAKGVFSEAESLYRRALEIDEGSLGHEHPKVAICLNNIARLLQQTNRLAEAEPLMRRALEIDEAALGADHPRVADDLNSLATLLRDRNRLAAAEPLIRRALEILEAEHGPDHPRVAGVLNNLGDFLQERNRLADAELLYRRALEINEAAFGPNHPYVGRSLDSLASLLVRSNRLAEAEPLYRRALEIDEAAFGPDHPNFARGLCNLGEMLRVANRLAEAEPMYRRALEIDEAAFGPDHPSVANNLNNLALLLLATNRLAEAEPLMRRALEITEASFGPDHPYVAITLQNLAGLLRVTNRLAEAEPLMLRALETFTRSYGKHHPLTATARGHVEELNRPPKARGLRSWLRSLFLGPS